MSIYLFFRPDLFSPNQTSPLTSSPLGERKVYTSIDFPPSYALTSLSSTFRHVYLSGDLRIGEYGMHLGFYFLYFNPGIVGLG